jgi:MFS family permease
MIIVFLLHLGVWLSAFSLGNFVGPTLAGFLVQTQGFRGTTTIFFGLYALMIVIDLSEAFFLSRRRQMQFDYESID